MLSAEQKTAIAEAAKSLSLEPAILEAFTVVESAGQVWAMVFGQRKPLIRIEGHYFYRLLKGSQLGRAVRLGLANRSAGAVKNPKSQEARYRMLDRMKEINEAAAIESCSWGAYQVMGAHWKWLDYASALDFEARVSESFAGQLDCVCRFLRESGALPHLKRRDWTAVARIYNGPNFRKYRYHTKLAEAYARIKGRAITREDVPKSAGMLRAGSAGPRVRELQTFLVRAGYSIKVDGDFGTSTEQAVRYFQGRVGIEVDGVAGPETMRKLQAYQQQGEAAAGAQPLLDVAPVRAGVGTVATGAGLAAAKEQVDALIVQTGAAGLDWLTTGLTLAGTGLVLGGLAYAAYGWLQSRRTIHGIEDEVATA